MNIIKLWPSFTFFGIKVNVTKRHESEYLYANEDEEA